MKNYLLIMIALMTFGLTNGFAAKSKMDDCPYPAYFNGIECVEPSAVQKPVSCPPSCKGIAGRCICQNQGKSH